MIVRDFLGRSMLVSSNNHVLSYEESTAKFKELEDAEQKLYCKVFSFHAFVPNFLEKLKSFFTLHDQQRFVDYENDIENLVSLIPDRWTVEKKNAFNKAIPAFCFKMISLDAPRDLVRLILKMKNAEVINNLEFRIDSPWSGRAYARWHTEIVKLANAANRVKNIIAESHQGLVGRIVRKYISQANEAQSAADLHQEGAMGLYRAIDKFEWRREHRFSTYANWWIRHHIARSISDKKRLIRLPVHIAEKANIIFNFQNEFLTKNARTPTIDEIKIGTKICKETVEIVVEGAHRVFSGDETLSSTNSEEGRTFWEVLADQNVEDPTDLMARAEMRGVLEAALSKLTEFEREILRKRFGFDIGYSSDEEFTLQEIGESRSLSRERIRQVQAQALGKMRNVLSKTMVMNN